jgi:hypothetical protein
MITWLFQPLMNSRGAVWAPVPDTGGVPVILRSGPLDTTDPNPLIDRDDNGNGIEDWMDEFYAFQNLYHFELWPGGNFTIDGYEFYINATWFPPGPTAVTDPHTGAVTHPPPDQDADGLPDELDDYPDDPYNNSFEWQGGPFTINGIYHAFTNGQYAGKKLPLHESGVPMIFMDWFNPQGQHQHYELRHFTGLYGVLINGQRTFIDPVSYWAVTGSPVDSDSDGIPDPLDPLPRDAWNNTYFEFPGIDIHVAGVWTAFAARLIPGLQNESDRDGDALPDILDLHPDDPTNDTEWWPGANQVRFEGGWRDFPPQYHRTSAYDSDGDSLPDDIDPYPASANNVLSFWWGGGVFMVDNESVEFVGGEIPGAYNDPDGDGIPNGADSESTDRYNRSDHDNLRYWSGATEVDPGIRASR